MAKISDLLLEYRQEGRKTWAIRFYQDGLVKDYSDSKMTFENGQIITHNRPLAWRKLAKLSPAELKKLLDAVHKADFFSLPEQLGDPNRVMDGTRYVWIVNLDGQKKTLLAFEPEASGSAGLKILGEMIQDVTADAFNRKAKEKESNEQH